MRTPVAPAVVAQTESPEQQPSIVPSIEPEKPALADIGERIGGENETLRNLLIDTGLQFRALDELKETFLKLTDPLGKLLETLEQVKFDNASLVGAHNELRGTHDTLRGDFDTLEKKASALESDNQRLARELAVTKQTAGDLEVEKTKLSNEIATVRVDHATIQDQLGEETNRRRALDDEKQLLLARAESTNKRLIESEAAGNLIREKHSLLENERDSLQSALDQTLGQSSRASRRLSEVENALGEARGRIQQLENNLSSAEEERQKTSAALDEANQNRQSEVYALTLKLDAMKSRAATAEKLLAELRQNLVARTEEIRVTEGKLADATVGRSAAEKKAEQHAAATETAERQAKRHEQARLALMERVKTLSETIKSRDSALAVAEDKIRSLGNRGELLKAEATSSSAKAEMRIEQLNAAVERERAARAVAEGALEATRADYARSQREFAAERALRRRTGSQPAEKLEEANSPATGNGARKSARSGLQLVDANPGNAA
jgi:chromosome segregation ATPase